MGNDAPLAGVHTGVTAPSTRSTALTSKVTAAPAAPVANVVMFSGSVSAGGVRSSHVACAVADGSDALCAPLPSRSRKATTFSAAGCVSACACEHDPGTLVKHRKTGALPTEVTIVDSGASGRGCTVPVPARPSQTAADTRALLAGFALIAAATSAAVLDAAPVVSVARDTTMSTPLTLTESGALAAAGWMNCTRGLPVVARSTTRVSSSLSSLTVAVHVMDSPAAASAIAGVNVIMNVGVTCGITPGP